MGWAEVYRGRRILITGHTGFKGAWLAFWLHQLGSKTKGLALPPPTDPNLFGLLDLGARMDSRLGDIRDGAWVFREITDFRPDVVFHLAAQALVLPSLEDPVRTFETNVMGTVHVLEACRRAGTPSVVVVTSDKCYRNSATSSHSEDDPLGGEEPYSASKAAAEHVAEAYHSTYLGAARQGLATARAGNVIGGGDWAVHRILPDFVRARREGSALRLRRPDAIRPWQFVLEPLRGYLMLGARLLEDPSGATGPWNFGPEPKGACTVAELLDLAEAAWPGPSWEREEAPLGNEAMALRLDSTKARERLGWTPRWDLKTSVEASIQWYRAWDEGHPLESLCASQVEAHG